MIRTKSEVNSGKWAELMGEKKEGWILERLYRRRGGERGIKLKIKR